MTFSPNFKSGFLICAKQTAEPLSYVARNSLNDIPSMKFYSREVGWVHNFFRFYAFYICCQQSTDLSLIRLMGLITTIKKKARQIAEPSFVIIGLITPV